MPGYDPQCGNCHRCSKCRGDGTVMVRKYDRDKHYDVRETCPTCNGVGGSVGVGEHRHN
ncbi:MULTISPECIES: hypothetical protein [unclassified Amycolatopsis]|uniref:hypothetical protein n=1 Tax=unclassified Amycolatopsis TaxID=2618356 RepID=UPI002E1ECE3C|nr:MULTISPECIES: hypothetical protein [unclassified Amycolatopsis]